MNDLISKLKQPSLWTISVQLLILYVVSVAVFFAANAVQGKVELGLKERVLKGSGGASVGLLVAALGLNFAAVGLVVFVTAKTGQNIRMAMIGVPFFLILEQHVRALRAHPHERRLPLVGMLGVAIGIVGGVAAFMPHAPLK